MNPASPLAFNCLIVVNLILTVFAVQHPAAHGLFDFLLAAQPHTVQPRAGMVLVHQIAVESHHCRPIKVIFIISYMHACSRLDVLRDIKTEHLREILTFFQLVDPLSTHILRLCKNVQRPLIIHYLQRRDNSRIFYIWPIFFVCFSLPWKIRAVPENWVESNTRQKCFSCCSSFAQTDTFFFHAKLSTVWVDVKKKRQHLTFTSPVDQSVGHGFTSLHGLTFTLSTSRWTALFFSLPFYCWA